MKNRLVLITGASRGLGRHLAIRFWEAGYSLFLVARDRQALVELSRNLPKKNKQIVDIFACDLSDTTQIPALVEQVESRAICVDVLVNNAAMHGPIGPLEFNDLELWRKALELDLMAPVTLCKLLMRLLTKATGGASIINISGGGATGPRPNFSAYATAKAGLVRFTETLAKEVSEYGMRVNCVAPGAMATSLMHEVVALGSSSAGSKELDIAKKTIEGGGASMDAVADLLLFLASDESKFITGKLISAVWDDWQEWEAHASELRDSDLYTLRRITARDRGYTWGDK